MKLLRIYAIFLFLVIINNCKAQDKTNVLESILPKSTPDLSDADPYFIETNSISRPYGPRSITRNILQDSKGNIWLATWEGIIRYDGKNFTNFTNKEELRRFHVFSLLEDSKGNIWFGTIGAGIYRYDGQSFTNFTTKEGLAHDRQGCIYEDKKGNIWFGTMGGISIYDGQSFRNFTTADGLTDNDINAIIEDENGVFWIGTRGAACLYGGQTFTKLTNKDGRSFVNVRTIIRDQSNNMWLGGNDGLMRYDGDQWMNFNENFVGYIYEDSKGDIWTSSEMGAGYWGLSRYDKKPLPYEMPTATAILEKADMFFGILEDNKGGIWLGTLNGVCRYDCVNFDYFKAEARE